MRLFQRALSRDVSHRGPAAVVALPQSHCPMATAPRKSPDRRSSVFTRKKKALSAGGVAALTLAALLTAVTGNPAQADDLVTHHEFQVNCTVHHRATNDPIVFPNMPGASHEHSFVG